MSIRSVWVAPCAAAAAMLGLTSTPGLIRAYAAEHPHATRLGIADPARAACVRMDRVQGLVDQNANYRQVFVEVAAAKAEAERATAADPSWRPLLGAVGAIDNGLRADDGEASRLGVAVLDFACRDLQQP